MNLFLNLITPFKKGKLKWKLKRNKMETHDCDGEKTQKYFNELCSVFYESGFKQEQIEDMVNHTYIPLLKEEGVLFRNKKGLIVDGVNVRIIPSK